MSKLIKYSILILITCLMTGSPVFGQIINVKGSSVLYLSNGSVLQINGGMKVDAAASVVHQNTGTSNLYMSGKFELLGTYTQDSYGRLTFNKGLVDTIAGNSSISLARLYLDKTGTNRVVLDPSTTLSISLLLILINGSLELVNSDLIIMPNAGIYANMALDSALLSFNINKCIVNSGSSSNVLLGGRVVKQFPNTVSLPRNYLFPVGTPGFYSPARLEILSGGASFGTNPEIRVKPVDKEHPGVEVEDKSLSKYWNVTHNDVTMNNSGANVFYYYNAAEVHGNEGNYGVLFFTPPYNDPLGYWRPNPGNDNDIVDFNNKFFYSLKVDSIRGDWTAGEPDVSEATYYSRQDGDWDDPNTWSKVNFGGPVSNTAPNKQSDRVRIQHNTVTIDAQPAPSRSIWVENGTDGRNPGKLRINDSYYVYGDTLIVEQNTTFSFAHPDGVWALPATNGCVRTNLRTFSSDATYEFIGNTNQLSGNGLPNLIKNIIVTKDAISDTVTLEKNISISSSFVINEGTFDLGSYSINGNSANRTFTMNGGEFITRSNFPTNYTAPNFTIGKVTFDGTGNSIVPSSSSTPAIAQYNNLKISGAARTGNITFPNSGEIRIKNELDISSLNFTDNIYRFLTDGSTVRFNKNGGTQNIPLKPANPSDTVVFLEYFNLILDSNGTKLLSATGSPTYKVLKNLTLSNNVDLDANNKNIDITGNWINQSNSNFIPGTGTVIMRSPVSLLTTNITSRDTTDNAFNNLLIIGDGIVKPLDNIKVNGNLTIASGATFNLDNKLLAIYGNWTNQGGTHQFATSTVRFSGNTTQTITATGVNVNFYNLIIDNPQNVNSSTVGNSGNGLIVNNNLTLNSGNLKSHDGTAYRYVTVLGTLSRPGNGFVDGELRKNIPTGSSTTTYEVGYKSSYTPVTIQMVGTGGTAGYFAVLSDTLGLTSTPVNWTSEEPPTDINPTGSTLNMLRHVARQYTLSVPSGSTFALGSIREYNVTAGYIAGSDIRNSADFTKFSGRLRSGSSWIKPFDYGTKPTNGTITSSSYQYNGLKDFGTLIFGEPGMILYYSLATGAWNVASNWSLQGYGGTPSSSFPGELSNNYKVLIGNGVEITMNANRTITNLSGDIAYVQIDSSGRLNMENFVLGGDGQFRLNRYGALGIGNTNGIVTAPTLSGNIQTTGARSYNNGSHNLGHFIYNGNGVQNTGNGLPSGTDSILTLTVNKTGTLTINTSGTLRIKDSLHIQSGTLSSGSLDIDLMGNFRIGTGATFTPNGRTFFFTGTRLQQQVTAPAANLTFSRLWFDKNKDSSNIKFMPTASGNSFNITIDSITFNTNNKAYIDLSWTYVSDNVGYRPDYNKGEWFMTMNNVGFTGTAGIGRLGLGHIEGELRKLIPEGTFGTNDTVGVRFEVGTNINYRPFVFRLENSVSGDVAGYIGVHNVPYYHPYADELSAPFYNLPYERMMRLFWRITRPSSSSFAKSTRLMNLVPNYTNPGDIPDGALVYCFDLAYWRGPNAADWQRLSPPSPDQANHGIGTCSNDRSVMNNEATYSPYATTTKTVAYDIAGSINLGTYDLSLGNNNRTLLGDIIIGQQGPATVHYYTRQSGNWTSNTTWSTEGYGGAAASSYPRERLHIAHIGDGDSVTLDANIAHSHQMASGTTQWREQRLGSVLLEKTPNGTGYLALGTFVIRASVFQMEDGCTIETGAEDGFHSSDTRGNIIREDDIVTISRNFNYGSHNNGNYVYKPKGKISATHTQSGYKYCIGTGLGSGLYINSVTLQGGGPTYTNNERGVSGFRYFPYNVFTLTAGQNYTFRINLTGASNAYYATILLDSNYSGSFTTSGPNEAFATVRGSSLNSYIDIPISVNSTCPQGTTQMRIIYRAASGTPNPCSPGTTNGEIEDYTVYIVNPNYVVNQQTGGAVPAQIASMTIDASSNIHQVQLNSNVSIKDSLYLKDGRFTPQSSTLKLQGDLVNNEGIAALDSANGAIIFDGSTLSEIRGTGTTVFNNIRTQKFNNLVNFQQNARINGTLFLDSNYKVTLDDNKSITFGTGAVITPLGGSFGTGRMIETSGLTTSGTLTKTYTTAAGTKNFYFPLGNDNLYNGAYLGITTTALTGTPSVTVQAINDRHPDRLTDSSITQYWRMSQTGLSDTTKITSDTMTFWYNQSEVYGRENLFIPGRRRNAPIPAPNGWEINLGTNPRTDIVNNLILIKDEKLLDGDWHTGEPMIYFTGRVFYSRVTGDWNVRQNWSTEPTLTHLGPAASYFPGQLYYNDTVNIDGHTITFKDSTHIVIDSLRIGGTNSSPVQGILNFGLVPASKTLELRNIFLDENGLITSLAGSREDTLKVWQDFRNNSTVSQNLRRDLTNVTHIAFTDTTNSRLYGTGNWGRLGNVILNKTGGLSDSLFIESAKFADATDTTQSFNMVLRSGILYHDINDTLSLSSTNNPVDLSSNTGITVKQGVVKSKSTVTTNSNTFIELDGGNFNVGDNADEHFLYNTGTTVNINDGDMTVAGAFARDNSTSLIDLTIENLNFIKVNAVGNTDPDKIGFDITNSASSFTMNGGRIIIANAGGTTPASADYRVSAQDGLGFVAGTVQSGDSLLTLDNTVIKIAGNTPVYDLHFANAPANDVETEITESIFTIKNDWTIDAAHSFNLNGNTVNLAGNLTNYGIFTGLPGGVTTDPWLIVLNGTANQSLFSNLSNFDLFNLQVSKTSGNVLLSGSGSSNLVVRNTLDFTSTNNSFIDASATGRYVEVSELPYSTPTIFRVGKGHVYGRLYRTIPSGSSLVNFPVGADTIGSYRPAIFETVGSGGTVGLVGVRHYPFVHPDTVDAPFQTDKNILKYWNVDNTGGFDLGSRTFNLTLRFINPMDLNGSNTLFNEQFRYSPAHPLAGDWTELNTPNKTDTTVQSISNTLFGDFAIGEPRGLTFYSYNDGTWFDTNTWSLDGYDSKTTPVNRYPNEATDIVRIGNGKEVILPNPFADTVRSIFVEVYNNFPGALFIEGDLNYIRGTNFVLEDSCTLGLMHLNGITPMSQGNSGAIQMNSRSFGVSRYVFNSTFGSQNTGLALPDSVKAIVIDNPSSPTRSVFLSNNASPTVRIQDTLLIRQGEFSAGARNLAIYSVLELDSVSNNGRLISSTAKLSFRGSNDKNIIFRNRSGINIYDMDIDAGVVKVKRPVAPLPDSAHLYIANILNFVNPNTYLELNDYVNLYINNNSTTAVQNYGSNRFVRTGLTSGYLIRKILPSSVYDYPVGVTTDYNRVEFTGLTGAGGYLGVRVSNGSQTNFAHLGASGIATSSFIEKYWTIDSVTAQINGKLRFYYLDTDIYGTETAMDKIGRWRPVKEQMPGSWTFPFALPSVDYSNNYFETSAGYSYSDFRGDWALGNDSYFRRLFYSRQTGNWNDENTWTSNPSHSGPIFGTGMYPNLGADSVTIGGGNSGVNNHIVTLNVNNPFTSPYNVGIAVGTGINNTGTLNLQNNILNGNIFNLNTLSTMMIGSADGIDIVGNNVGNIQTSDIRNYSNSALYIYNGSQSQITGYGLPNQVYSLKIANSGVGGNNNVTLLSNVDITDSLSIETGRFDISAFNASSSSASGHFRLFDNAYLAISATSNMLTSVNNYLDYNISDNSWVEFYGSNQLISSLPVNLTQNFISNTGGFGNVFVRNPGTKTVGIPLLIRGNLVVETNAILTISEGVDALRVLKTVNNSATITNNGVIEIGECP